MKISSCFYRRPFIYLSPGFSHTRVEYRGRLLFILSFLRTICYIQKTNPHHSPSNQLIMLDFVNLVIYIHFSLIYTVLMPNFIANELRRQLIQLPKAKPTLPTLPSIPPALGGSPSPQPLVKQSDPAFTT